MKYGLHRLPSASRELLRKMKQPKENQANSNSSVRRNMCLGFNSGQQLHVLHDQHWRQGGLARIPNVSQETLPNQPQRPVVH
jgi:hypothetical protein